jgi:hypothetical protein
MELVPRLKHMAELIRRALAVSPNNEGREATSSTGSAGAKQSQVSEAISEPRTVADSCSPPVRHLLHPPPYVDRGERPARHFFALRGSSSGLT